MNGYLLDTNICIFAMRGKYDVIDKMESIGREKCFVSDVTVMELRFGAYKSKKQTENLHIVNKLLSKVRIIPFADGIDFFCQEKLRLQKLGTPIEDFDLLIGSAAKVSGLIMVTDNIQHFNRIDGLSVENWIQR